MKNIFLISIIISFFRCSNVTKPEDARIYKDSSPAWSPEGKEIVYNHSSLGEDNKYPDGLYMIDTTGNYRTLIKEGKSWEPDWSPDGEKVSYSDGNNLFTIDVKYKSIINITNQDSFLTFPSWHPAGERLTFSKIKLSYKNYFGRFSYYKIYDTWIDSEEKTPLVKGFASDWSPSGEKLVYTSHIDTSTDIYGIFTYGIYTYDVNRDSVTLLFNLDQDISFKCSWSSNREKIAFEKRWVKEIWIMNSDGTNPNFLVNGTSPSFSPDSKKNCILPICGRQ